MKKNREMKTDRKRAGRLLLLAALLSGIGVIFAGCGPKQENEVVVYTAVDEVFSESVIKKFEEETGITVQIVYDTEANKTTGLVNRIISESKNPMCDVFWNNEFVQTIDLDKKGMLAAYQSPSAKDIPDYYKSDSGTWTAVGGRARVFLVNNDLLPREDFPMAVRDLIGGKYNGDQIAIAYPMFGTTKTMAAALYAQWGEEQGREYFEKLVSMGVQVVDGNSVTKDMAATGQVAIGFTDSDDAREAISDGANVTMVYPDQEDGGMGTLVTPSTVALIKGAPHRGNAEKFIDFVLSERIERELVDAGFYDISIRDSGSIGTVRGMTIDLEKIYNCMDVSAKDMEELFSSAN